MSQKEIRKWFLNERRSMLTRIVQQQLLDKTPDDLICDQFTEHVCEAFRIDTGQVHNQSYFIALSRTYLPIFERGINDSRLHTHYYVYQHMVRNFLITMRGQIGPESFIRTYVKQYLNLESSPPYFATGMPDTFLNDFSRLVVPNSGYRFIFYNFFLDCTTACSNMRTRLEPCIAIQDAIRDAQAREALEVRMQNVLEQDSVNLVKSFLGKYND